MNSIILSIYKKLTLPSDSNYETLSSFTLKELKFAKYSFIFACAVIFKPIQNIFIRRFTGLMHINWKAYTVF